MTGLFSWWEQATLENIYRACIDTGGTVEKVLVTGLVFETAKPGFVFEEDF